MQFILFRFVSIDNEKETIGTVSVIETNGLSLSSEFGFESNKIESENEK